jgi:gas vesicle protein
MMKKYVRMIIGGAIGAALLATVAIAAPVDGDNTAAWCGRPGWGRGANLTTEQQKEMQPINDKMTSLRQQMLETRKEALQKEVQFGNVTQEQADQIINRMNERMKQAGSGNGYCYGGGSGMDGGHYGHHRGGCGGF